jgi:hypothetical protein
MFDFLVLARSIRIVAAVTVTSLSIGLCYSMFPKLFQFVEHIHIMVSAEHHETFIYFSHYSN